MILEMRLRRFLCADCRKPCKSTSPNAQRCRDCSKAHEVARAREYSRKRYAAAQKAKRPSMRCSSETLSPLIPYTTL